MSVIHKILHPVMRKLAQSLISFPVSAYEVNPIPNKSPIIFVANHSNAHDFPLMLTVLSNQFFVLADDDPRGTVTGLAFEANGVIWVNRSDKGSARESLQAMRQHLKKGHDLLIFPEGTWNVTECLPMLPITWSTTELAREFNCPIVPITLEYPDFESCYYSIGAAFYVQSSEEKSEAAARLRDTMATMRWKFWESRGMASRDDISAADYNIYSIDRFKEYRPENWEEDFAREQKKVFRPYITPEQVFEHLEYLIPRRENAFLFSQKWSR